MTNLFQMIRRSDQASLVYSIEDANINQENDLKRNLLQTAIAYGRTEIGLKLIERGIDLDHQDSTGLTPLHFAAVYRNSQLAAIMIAKGAAIAIVDDHGNAPLWTAVFNAKGDYSVVKLLMANGASAHERNKHGRSPIDLARQLADAQLIGILEGA